MKRTVKNHTIARCIVSVMVCFILFAISIPGIADDAASQYEYDKTLFDMIDAKKPRTQVQIDRYYDSTFSKRKEGLCNVASMTTLLNRSMVYHFQEGSFSPMDVLKACGCTNIAVKDVHYTFNGDSGNWNSRTYTKNNITFKVGCIYGSTVKANTSKANFYAYLANLLHKYPEGIALRNNKANHVFVIYKYTYSNGVYKLFVKDPVDNYSGPMENSYLYKKCGGDIYTTLDFIVYISSCSVSSHMLPYTVVRNVDQYFTINANPLRPLAEEKVYTLPYDTGTSQTKKALSIVHIVQIVKNNSGEEWAKLDDGTFIKKSKITFQWEESTVTPGVYKAKIKTQWGSTPFDAEGKGTDIAKNQEVKVVRAVKNKYSNIWYELDERGSNKWVYSGHFDFVKKIITVDISNVNAPAEGGNLPKGKSFSLKGKITASENIVAVTGSIYDLSTGKLSTAFSPNPVTVKPNAKTFEISGSNIDNKITFGKLGDSTYRYEVVVTTASGYEKKVITRTFTVGTVKSVRGDADGNGIFDFDDIMRMINHYCGLNVSIVSANCDLNGNGNACDFDDILTAIDIYCR